ncbi:hypothetical protein H6790_02115 [Candidatus Nomurabacteria bacterium]|nr:hypothetical protein [Candidatus Nomurabacteria bacterium]MCB9820718.1 hypothetical protein [Candidatus Nomurabacteria bacterium]
MKTSEEVYTVFYKAYHAPVEDIYKVFESTAVEIIDLIMILGYTAKTSFNYMASEYAIKKLSEYDNANVPKWAIGLFAKANPEEFFDVASRLVTNTPTEKITREIVVVLAQGFNTKGFEIIEEYVLLVVYISTLLSNYKGTDMINKALVKKLSLIHNKKNLNEAHSKLCKLLESNIAMSK